jgi:hypothetical protein
MTQDNLSDEERREILVRNWEEKPHEALRAAKLLREAETLDAAVNRAYYACSTRCPLCSPRNKNPLESTQESGLGFTRRW